MKRAVFLDRDGVINDVIDHGEEFGWTAPWKSSEFHLKSDAVASLMEIAKLDFLSILVTNQPDVGYGLMTKDEFEAIMAETMKLPFDDVFVCTHGRDENCPCKKPKPGMLLDAAKKWDIDLKSSFMIGDMESDIEAGNAAGCTTILIDQDYNQSVIADVHVKNLSEGVKYIHENIH